ncbi:(2Fe-2S)-binding protein [Kitasatospora sp. NPDC086009]|uniref:(2Fe-2S)-binding protein n=1 Tax=unclassified Kitasatospora TaxID=2633591 RepID=UPI0037C73095
MDPTHTLPTGSEITLTANGRAHTLVVDHRATLLDVLRERLGLTGAKQSCDHGQCGARTVLQDGRRVNSCRLPAVAQDGAAVTTVEGLAGPDGPHPLQRAFVDQDAFQCGFCTAGQLCSAAGLLAETADDPLPVDEATVREQLSGNICRCGASPGIVRAVLRA